MGSLQYAPRVMPNLLSNTGKTVWSVIETLMERWTPNYNLRNAEIKKMHCVEILFHWRKLHALLKITYENPDTLKLSKESVLDIPIASF